MPEQPKKQQNRRRAIRGPTRSNVRIQCRQGAWGFGPNIGICTLDVSDTGARLVVSKSLEPKSEVEIIIEGYGLKGNIKRLGTIRWQVAMDTGEYCVGIEFQRPLPHRDWHSIVAPM